MGGSPSPVTCGHAPACAARSPASPRTVRPGAPSTSPVSSSVLAASWPLRTRDCGRGPAVASEMGARVVMHMAPWAGRGASSSGPSLAGAPTRDQGRQGTATGSSMTPTRRSNKACGGASERWEATPGRAGQPGAGHSAMTAPKCVCVMQGSKPDHAVRGFGARSETQQTENPVCQQRARDLSTSVREGAA
jgi:hypothetical protein